ncbi:MAG: type III-B CRISPR module RAMP protein Cmr6 [Deltaproteobacteria bacterium]|nr:type III-B CRISPR module RAMP protein Cmr6 [Deltaproteobacteria bacterium]
MGRLPLPRNIARWLDLSNYRGNLSLLFDRGMDGYGQEWGIRKADPKKGEEEGRKKFLTDFVESFSKAPLPEYDAFIARRHASFEFGVKAGGFSAKRVELKSGNRLVIGLGLPHPTETGFLFDRLTGCPYLPGSSVKGMLRAAAGLTAEGNLEGDTVFWRYHQRRIFGSDKSDPAGLAKGRMVFYDAFPKKWPRLAIDILTPHYPGYYSGKGNPYPGDWESPRPIPLITIEAGATFVFHIESIEREEKDRKQDELAVEGLLTVALDWLGIGGKKSAGYGMIWEKVETPVATGN